MIVRDFLRIVENPDMSGRLNLSKLEDLEEFSLNVSRLIGRDDWPGNLQQTPFQAGNSAGLTHKLPGANACLIGMKFIYPLS